MQEDCGETQLPAYAELHCLSNFTFLRGASHPHELVERAQALEQPAGHCSRIPAVLAGLPQPMRPRQMRHQGIRPQLAAAHRCRQLQYVQTLGEKRGESLPIRTRRREAEDATRFLPLSVSE